MKGSIRNGTAAACLLIISFGVSVWAQQEGAPNPSAAAGVTPATSTATATGTVVPRFVQFSGAVTDATGKPVSGPVLITFSLYSLQEGGTPLWTETKNITLDSEGRYEALLGADSPEGLPLDLFTSGAARWLGVTPDLPGTGEQPRVLLVGMPYALKAADADTLGGLPASAFMQTALAGSSATVSSATKGSSKISKSTSADSPFSTILGAGTTSFVPLWTGNYTIQNSNLYQSGGNLGIGTTTPSATLEVNGTSKFDVPVTFAAGQKFPGTGTVTSVGSGTGLTGGPITGSGTLSLAAANCPGGQAAVSLPLNCAPFATLGSNTFLGNETLIGNQTVNGTLTTTGEATFENALTTDGVITAGGISVPANKLTVGVNQLVLANGDVGIGTTAPGALLDIEGGTAAEGANAPPALNVVAATGGLGGFTGGALALAGGQGGAASTAEGNGGNGGGLTLSAGAGAEAIEIARGGDGGGLTLKAGGGGGSPGGIAGKGGSISIEPGAGGIGGMGIPGGGGLLLLSPNGTPFFGSVGVGSTSPDAFFSVGPGHDTRADAWTVRSSRRWKTNIQTLPDGLEKVERLRGVTYDRKDTGKHEIGVIAEEVGQVVPEVVSYEKDGVTATGVDYDRLTALLIEGMKEQQREINGEQRAIRIRDAQIRLLNRQVHQLQGVRLAVTTLQIRIDRLESAQQSGPNLRARALSKPGNNSPGSSATKAAF